MTEAARDRANQWTAFYMITAFVMKELNKGRLEIAVTRILVLLNKV